MAPPLPTSSRPSRRAPTVLALALLLAAPGARAQGAPAPVPAGAPSPGAPVAIRVKSDAGGLRLSVDGKDFMVLGMNWDYFPIGTNYNYSLWSQPDDVIEAALGREMPLLRRMGVNAIRQYAGIPPRWVRYIYERWGIWTVVNPTVGRYGMTVDGTWMPQVDYSSPRIRALLKAEVLSLVEQFRGTPGMLMWLLGNENNYGLSWSSFEIEALPAGERDAARARHLYSLLGEIIREVKARDPAHPVAIANGDLQYVDLIARECQGLDVLGANVYRGASARDLFQVVHDKLGVPVMFTEFGADAFDARRGREDDVTQARYLVAQWKEIYEQSAGKGGVGNAIGGFVFQWADGWWKYMQESNLDVHDTNASWPNAGYAEDYVEGANNMNEEWWGICAKGPPDGRGLFDLYPRTAYYALQEAFRLPPYAPGTDRAAIERHFDAIDLGALAGRYQAASASLAVAELARVRLTGVRLHLETYSTGGKGQWARPDVPNGGKGFDHTESLFVDAAVEPTAQVKGTVSLNVLGNVARNPIDEIFYEKRGWPIQVVTPNPDGTLPCTAAPSGQITCATTTELRDVERVKLYKAGLAWDDPWFHLDGFYRTGHYHWGYEGDLFGLYREANYGENLDIYQGEAPFGVEVAGKQALTGLKVAFGPQLWWGANPAVMAKYQRRLGRFGLTAMFQQDVALLASGAPSGVPISTTRNRVAALGVTTAVGPANLEAGLLWSGSPKLDAPFHPEGSSTATDHVVALDALGAKAKVTVEGGGLHWYAQSAFMGLVADAGPDPRVTFTGWTLKDSGSGNQGNFLTGLAWNVGQFQIAPNVLWQKPLVGPGQSISGGARHSDVDPFAVRANRETVAGELLLTFDPTPATWPWQWDNDLREDAPFMASLDFSYRHQPTTTDAAFYYLADGKTRLAFNGGQPAADVWEVRGRVVAVARPDLRLVAHLWAGTGQANGDSARLVQRYGADARLTWRSLVGQGFVKLDDWGPYDYHRDFNLTYPLQVMGDLSYVLGPARWLWQQQTRLGVRGTLRTLDWHSARYVVDPADLSKTGLEYELRTYLVVTL